jgi:polysaccharide deacetylase family protein (PEP-CTERM system associated)
MSVDLEDHFCDLPFSTWGDYESRVEQTTNVLLQLFDKYAVTATFFTVGYVAEKHPELIKKIVSKGHEIASHGYSHKSIKTMSEEEFENDLTKSIQVLEKLTNEKILGFRAPWCSIDSHNLWAFSILRKYLQYDSSIYPVKFHYGWPDAPRHSYRISNDNPPSEDTKGEFTEFPLTTLRIPLYGNLPVSGGIYLRFLPVQLLKIGIKKLNDDGHPAMFYIHPQDLDPHRPHLKGLAWHNYVGLKRSVNKFETVLKSFKFCAARDLLEI